MSKRLLLLFFCSGISAIVYQVIWQRVLFASFGTNIEAITVIVSVFMFGLGMGSLIGGKLSNTSSRRLLYYFIFFEISIGLFGLISLQLIEYVSHVTLHLAPAWLPLVVFTILFIPTFAMGATLPVLVSYLFKEKKSVGDTVSNLYYINTLGSAIGSLLTVSLLFYLGTLQSTVYIAASINFTIALLTFIGLQKKQPGYEN
jgi:predicted membrane-bound spermidine synthase